WERLLLVKDYIDMVLIMLSKDNSPDARQDYNRLKKIMLTEDDGSEYVTISMMHLLITALIAKLRPVTQDLDLPLDLDSDDTAFDEDLEYEDDAEETMIGPKKRRIKINTPINISGLLDRIKLSLYKALLHYWPDPDINVYLACQLDPRCKRLLPTSKRDKAEEALHMMYAEFKAQYYSSKQVASVSSTSISTTNQDKEQAYYKGFIKS
ncbi:3698_t:CDS:2, partial [Cetraspora pellucida]